MDWSVLLLFVVTVLDENPFPITLYSSHALTTVVISDVAIESDEMYFEAIWSNEEKTSFH